MCQLTQSTLKNILKHEHALLLFTLYPTHGAPKAIYQYLLSKIKKLITQNFHQHHPKTWQKLIQYCADHQLTLPTDNNKNSHNDPALLIHLIQSLCQLDRSSLSTQHQLALAKREQLRTHCCINPWSLDHLNQLSFHYFRTDIQTIWSQFNWSLISDVSELPEQTIKILPHHQAIHHWLLRHYPFLIHPQSPSNTLTDLCPYQPLTQLHSIVHQYNINTMANHHSFWGRLWIHLTTGIFDYTTAFEHYQHRSTEITWLQSLIYICQYHPEGPWLYYGLHHCLELRPSPKLWWHHEDMSQIDCIANDLTHTPESAYHQFNLQQLRQELNLSLQIIRRQQKDIQTYKLSSTSKPIKQV